MAKIGVFDSGYGGLTILEKIRHRLPEYDYIYLGDNARTPYGTRSFEVIYEYTWQCVRHLFNEGCELVILACNTASAKALRSIQQHELLDVWAAEGSQRKRVLGVIRPTVEVVPTLTHTGHIGILATPGTVSSLSYVLELEKIDPSLQVVQEPCPMWVPIIEAGEHLSPGADWFVEKYVNELLARDPHIDTIILGCTHYPLLRDKIQKVLPPGIQLVAQGDIVADSLADYLTRHADLASCLDKASLSREDVPLSASDASLSFSDTAPVKALGTCRFQTTESVEKFRQSASVFLREPVTPEHVEL